MKSLFLAFSFLTKIPVKVEKITERDLGKAIAYFPVVGAFEGFFCSLSIFIFLKHLSFELLALLSLLVLFLIRGIFHLDGLSDTFDALSIKNSGERKKDIEKRLKIMKDSTVGVGGVYAIIMDLLLKFILIKEIIQYSNFFIALILTYSFSRWAIIPVIYLSKPAKNSGLGYLLIKNISLKEIILSFFLIFLIWLIVFWNFYRDFKIFGFLILVFALILLGFLFKKIFERLFDGITGDNLGALVEIFEILLLIFWRVLWQRL